MMLARKPGLPFMIDDRHPATVIGAENICASGCTYNAAETR
jgi:hypothetical protein